ncbi:MAG TPA: hypothetical protein VGW12_10745 [Pyrinomonadaceae bacterium]|nr:hypothetical protein [Pyrinomonadaceae bacterium]
MRGYVHGRIDELKRDNLNNALGGLRANIKAYEDADSPTERQTWLDASLSQFNMAQPYFLTTKQKYVPGTASLALSLATMHLMLLRERVLHAREIFGTDKVNPKHKTELTNSIKTYQDFIRDVAIPGEMKWREKMLEVKETGPDIIGQAGILVRDHAAREVHSFTKSANRGRGGNHTVLFRYYKEQALNSYRVALEAGVGDPARLWTLLDPEQANARPIPFDRVIWVGPCSGLSFKANNEHGLEDSVKHEDRPGVIKRIVVREYNEIDYLKFIYDGHEGHGSGNQQGGVEHTIEVPQGKYIMRVETWWDWELVGIKFHFSDGTSTQKFGDRTGMGHHYQTASYPSHRLSAVRYDDRDGKKTGLTFAFSPLPNYYEAKS